MDAVRQTRDVGGRREMSRALAWPVSETGRLLVGKGLVGEHGTGVGAHHASIQTPRWSSRQLEELLS